MAEGAEDLAKERVTFTILRAQIAEPPSRRNSPYSCPASSPPLLDRRQVESSASLRRLLRGQQASLPQCRLHPGRGRRVKVG